MFRFWAREIKENHILRDLEISDGGPDTRTHKVFAALDKICVEFDLSAPIWLQSNIDEFKRLSKTRFTKDNFVDDIEFDYLEVQILEEDF